MKNRATVVLLSAGILLGSTRTCVMAAEQTEGAAVLSVENTAGSENLSVDESLSDDRGNADASKAESEGDINKMAADLAEKTKEDVQKYLEEMETARKAAEEKTKAEEEAERELEEKKKKEEEQKKAQEEARRKDEEEERQKKAAYEKAEEERLAKRQEIVDFALQFEGNPYVYGGTSLTSGADCSGFVMSVFKEFGYELPRVAADQYSASAKKSLEDIEQGDLVFYGDYGIDHVALYIGNGEVIHASTAATGIKISDYTYRQPAGVGTYLD